MDHLAPSPPESPQDEPRPPSPVGWGWLALGFGLVAQALLWDSHGVGLNWTLLVVLAGGLWWGALHSVARPAKGTLVWLGLAWAGAGVFSLLNNLNARFWAWLVTALATFLALAAYPRGDAWQATAWGWLRLLGDGLLALFVHPWSYLSDVTRRYILQARWKSIVLGLFLLAPIFVCFAVLLSSADPVFAQFWKNLFTWEKVFEILLRGLLALFWGWVWLAGVLLARQAGEVPSRAGQRFPLAQRLPFAVTAVVLGGVLLLFLSFLLVQARYLFADDQALAAYGLTYAQYARRGFGWLVVTALLAYGLLISADALTQRQGRSQRAFLGLAWGWVFAVLLMLASAAYRLHLYVAAYAWTVTRLQVAVFMAWLAIAWLITAWVLSRPHPHRWPLVVTVPFLGFVFTLVSLNPTAWVVKHNARLTHQGYTLDTAYLLDEAALSVDLWPALEEVYRDPQALAPQARSRLGGALACLFDDAPASLPPPQWRHWTLSRAQAVAAYQRLRDQVQSYPLRPSEKSGVFTEVQVDGEWIPCEDLLSPWVGDFYDDDF